MKDLTFRELPRLAISAGSSTPAPGNSSWVWSTVENAPLVWNGSSWVAVGGGGGGGGASTTISETPPGSPSVGDLWVNSNDMTLNTYYNDGTSSQWVEISSSPAGEAGLPTGGTSGQVLTKNSSGDFDTSWVTPPSAPDPLDLVYRETVSAPPNDTVRLFGRRIAGRVLPAFIGPSGLDSALQPLLARNKVGWFNPPGNSTTVQTLGMNVSASGTATSANIATTNILTATRRLEYAVTTAATTAVAGVRSTALQYHIGLESTPYGGFTFIARFGPSRGSASNSTRRFWAGMTSVTAAPSDTDPSTWATNGIGVGTDSTDTNFQIMHRNGTGAMTKIDTGIPKSYADNTQLFELAIFTAPTGTTEIGIRFTRLSDGVYFSASILANIPSATQLLTWQIWNSVGGTSSVIGMSIASVYVETDF